MDDVCRNFLLAAGISLHVPSVFISWAAEKSFVAMPQLPPGISRAIHMAMRRRRKSWVQSRNEMQAACLGLLKSALITAYASVMRCNFAWDSMHASLCMLKGSPALCLDKGDIVRFKGNYKHN